MTLEYQDQKKQNINTMLCLMKNALETHFTKIIGCIYHNTLVYLLHAPSPEALAQSCYTQLLSDGYYDQIRAGISLPFEGLNNISTYYTQAHYAMQRADKDQPANFYYVAADYLAITSMNQESLCACEPNVREMWYKEPEKREYLKTLQVYLEYERAATLAANHLFIHKNTLNYRINYFKERYGWDLDDPKLRNYLRISLFTLNHIGQ